MPTDQSWSPCSRASGSRRSSTARPVRWCPNRSSTRPATTATTWPAGWPSSRQLEPSAFDGSCSPRPPRCTGSRAATPIPEDAPLAPINPYGETKRTFEAGLRWYGGAYGLRSVALRYFNVAGASDRNGECHEPETHLIPNVLAAAETGRPVTIFGTDYPTPDGTNVRDYIHVLDLADGHLAALEATAPTDPRTADPDDPGDPARGRAVTLNLGSAAGFSVRQVIAAAERVVGRPIPTAPGPRRPGDPPILVAANERAGEVLGWTPRRGSLDEMIGSAWAWRRRHPNGYRDGS